MSFVYWEDVARSPAFLAVRLVLFRVPVVDQSFGPILPWFVTALTGDETQAGAWAGFISSATASTTAFSATRR